MRSPLFWLALTAASLQAGSVLAQSPPTVTTPAPAPTVTAPAVIPGAPVAPLTETDSQFVTLQVANNRAEFEAAQLALQHSQNQEVRNFASKLITDHTYAENQLAPILEMHHMQVQPALTQAQLQEMSRLSQLQGPAFDHAYVNAMVQEHQSTIDEFNAELVHGLDQHVSAWLQNTRPMLLQHLQIAQQLLATLPNPG
ncbi:MAG TPA: DUF4142 domain-containing protein [Acetobacteraceae bacterium]|nr:DUF4142 domain-containing protein [Acetobacteraceae bacterium]